MKTHSPSTKYWWAEGKSFCRSIFWHRTAIVDTNGPCLTVSTVCSFSWKFHLNWYELNHCAGVMIQWKQNTVYIRQKKTFLSISAGCHNYFIYVPLTAGWPSWLLWEINEEKISSIGTTERKFEIDGLYTAEILFDWPRSHFLMTSNNPKFKINLKNLKPCWF